MGGLHIEQQLLKINGQLTKGSGMDAIIGKAGLEYIGLATAFTDVNDIKKAPYAIQVEVACLYKMLQAAYSDSGTSTDILTWAEQQTNPMFSYWFKVMLFQFNILLFVRSLRESNMTLFLSSMKTAVPMCFALDHTHYARWLSVFIRDIELLYIEYKECFDEIGKHLSVRSTDTEFSKVAYDQRHEQNNKVIKVRNGYINLTNKEDKTFLRKLELCSSEVYQFLDKVEQRSEDVKHKEQRTSFNKTYLNHCNKVFSMMTVNPFTAEQFQMLSGSTLFSNVIVKDCMSLFDTGKLQYENFIKSRFLERTEDVISTPIPRNNFKLPRDWSKVANQSPQIKLSPKIITTLRAACESRPEASKEMFSQEFTGVPECLVDKEGKPFHSGKSDLLNILAAISIPALQLPHKVDGLIIDASVVIKSLAVFANSSNQGSYLEFAKYILRQLESMALARSARRLDIVFDTYQSNSIKNVTREGRGMGVKIVFKEEDMLPDDLKDFFLNEDNKKNFYQIIQKQAANPLFWEWTGEVTITFGQRSWSRNDGVKDIVQWRDEVHEEADNRMLVHAQDLMESDNDVKCIVIRTNDTDVVMLFLTFFEQFLQFNDQADFWIDFGLGDYRRFISIKR